MSGSLSSLVSQVYSPPSLQNGYFEIEKWLGTDAIRYYSSGRFAMIAAFRLLGVGPGDTVALPEFICRQLLSSVASVGAKALFYAVDEELSLASPPSRFEGAKAIVVVNFFGFPQELTTFRKISEQNGAVLIEDNAHGFLSRDVDGVPLGRRAPLAVFSFRKTLPLANGAALVANAPQLAARLPEQLSFVNENLGVKFLLKRCLRSLVPITGIFLCRSVMTITRLFRKGVTGHAISPSGPDDEIQPPTSSAPYKGLMEQIGKTNESEEVARRRDLYLAIYDEISRLGGVPVFNHLPKGVAPYVFPFRTGDRSLGKIHHYLTRMGLECHRWPDLPEAVKGTAKGHYTNVWMVPLLW